MRFDDLNTWMWLRMETEWPDHLTYHSPAHVQDVCQAAHWYAREEGISDRDEILVLTAALYHDAGFLIATADHEARSCQLVREELPHFDYPDADIEHICDMIMATRLPQTPRDHLARILCDADLDYLGRDDYFPIAETLFTELRHQGVVKTETDWLTVQVRFLESHQYHTHTAHAAREAAKQKVLTIVKAKLNAHLSRL